MPEQKTPIIKTLIFAALSSVILGVAGFVIGLIIQNWLFPSPVTAAAGWLLYFTPFVALSAVGIGIILGFIAIWARLKGVRRTGYTLAIIIAILVGGLSTFGHYWIAGILVFLGLWLSYYLAYRTDRV